MGSWAQQRSNPYKNPTTILRISYDRWRASTCDDSYGRSAAPFEPALNTAGHTHILSYDNPMTILRNSCETAASPWIDVTAREAVLYGGLFNDSFIYIYIYIYAHHSNQTKYVQRCSTCSLRVLIMRLVLVTMINIVVRRQRWSTSWATTLRHDVDIWHVARSNRNVRRKVLPQTSPSSQGHVATSVARSRQESSQRLSQGPCRNVFGASQISWERYAIYIYIYIYILYGDVHFVYGKCLEKGAVAPLTFKCYLSHFRMDDAVAKGSNTMGIKRTAPCRAYATKCLQRSSPQLNSCNHAMGYWRRLCSKKCSTGDAWLEGNRRNTIYKNKTILAETVLPEHQGQDRIRLCRQLPPRLEVFKVLETALVDEVRVSLALCISIVSVDDMQHLWTRVTCLHSQPHCWEIVYIQQS